jgi:hypothetical protein
MAEKPHQSKTQNKAQKRFSNNHMVIPSKMALA